MAKILTGPLAAGLSGKLGPVVFSQTRFGQVVQSKAKPRTYTTPAAMATKQAFREGATAMGSCGQGLWVQLKWVTDRLKTTPAGLFIPRYTEWRRGGTFTPYLFQDLGEATITGHSSVGLRRRVQGTLTNPSGPNQAYVFWWSLENNRLNWKASSLWNEGNPLSGLSSSDVPEPFVAIAFNIDLEFPTYRGDPEWFALYAAYGSMLPPL